MATLDTGDLTLPNHVIDPWLGKVRAGSTIAQLSDSEPMKFGTGEWMTFDIGEAEYVGEGVNKSGSTVTPTTKTVKPFKFQKTVRMTDEVRWADEDRRAGIIEQILAEIQPALSRALDYGVYHGIDPLSGDVAGAMTETLSDTTNSVEIASQEGYALIDAADTLVLADEYLPTDIALDPSLAASFYTDRNTTTEQKRHPDFQLTGVSTLEGHRSAVSRTVGAVGVATVDTDVKAFVGQFDAIRWGVQRAIGLELIEYGDPDGGGDLKRNNQIAFRAEVVYGWGIADLNAFAKIIDAVA